MPPNPFELDLASLATQMTQAPAALISINAWMQWLSGAMLGTSIAVLAWRRAKP